MIPVCQTHAGPWGEPPPKSGEWEKCGLPANYGVAWTLTMVDVPDIEGIRIFPLCDDHLRPCYDAMRQADEIVEFTVIQFRFPEGFAT